MYDWDREKTWEEQLSLIRDYRIGCGDKLVVMHKGLIFWLRDIEKILENAIELKNINQM